VSEITRSTDHRYTYHGLTYPGVTSILRIIDKSDALMSWAARMTAEAALANIGTLPHLLETVGPEGVVRALTARGAWQRDEAAALGTEVHHLADQLAQVLPLPETISPIAAVYARHYLAWWQSSGWTLRASEAMLVNPELGYGGTLDLLCRDRDGRTVLADIKTGRAVYHETALQLAAYGMAELIEAPEIGLCTMPAVDRYVVVHVTGDGVREVEMAVGGPEAAAFQAAMILSAWRQSTKGRKL